MGLFYFVQCFFFYSRYFCMWHFFSSERSGFGSTVVLFHFENSHRHTHSWLNTQKSVYVCALGFLLPLCCWFTFTNKAHYSNALWPALCAKLQKHMRVCVGGDAEMKSVLAFVDYFNHNLKDVIGQECICVRCLICPPLHFLLHSALSALFSGHWQYWCTSATSSQSNMIVMETLWLCWMCVCALVRARVCSSSLT